LKIHIIGLGYIGIPTAVFFASAGFSVHGSDTNEARIRSLQSGNLPFEEPGLREIFRDHVTQGSLSFSADVEAADVFVVCVPTPVITREGISSADLTSLWSAVEKVSTVIHDENLIIVESTIPVGTTSQVRDYIRQARPELQGLKFAYAPERVLPGAIVEEMTHNPRIVGGVDDVSTAAALELYRHLTRGQVDGVAAEVAELTKLVENSYRDVNLAFANELSMVAARLGVPVDQVIRLANLHPRVSVLTPGPGVGGHCIPVDPWFLIQSAPDLTPLTLAARKVNTAKERWVLDQMVAEVGSFFERVGRRPTVAILGLTYKANVGDLRESPALRIAELLSNRGDCDVVISDPHVLGEEAPFPLSDLLIALEVSDIVTVLVSHDQFANVEALLVGQEKRLLDFTGAR